MCVNDIFYAMEHDIIETYMQGIIRCFMGESLYIISMSLSTRPLSYNNYEYSLLNFPFGQAHYKRLS